jgi:hypothetical protein
MASLKFYQYKESDGNTMIFMSFTFNHERLRLSSGLSIPAKAWDAETQKAKPAKDFVECNRKLREFQNSSLINMMSYSNIDFYPE